MIMTVSKCWSFDFTEVDKGMYVHFGTQEDSNSENIGAIKAITIIIKPDSPVK